jgi:predicted amidohydrolase YtcJ
VHLLAYGRQKREVDLSGATTLDELVRRVTERTRERPAGSWIFGSGWELDDLPHHEALSRATPDHPVWLVRKDAHSGLANARAMERVDFAAVPEGGRVDRERGLFFENATELVDRLVPEEAPAATFLAAQRDALPFGITGVHDARVDDGYLRALLSIEEARSLRLRVHAMVWDADPERMIQFMRSRPPRTGGRLAVRAVKLFMDGSLGSGTAWMLRPPRGMPVLAPAQAERVARAALETGYQVCAHAIGDRANRELLDLFERIGPPAEARWRVEHAQHVHPADLPRFGRWIASVQPSHCVADRAMSEARLSEEERGGTYAWRRLGRLALGTDAPVDRLDPRWTFYCAVTREGWRTGDALAPEQALRGMTADAAYAGFMEGGILAPGRPADMAVLSHDWLKIPPKEVLESQVLATIMDGRVACASREL